MRVIKTTVTDANGRIDQPLLAGESMVAGHCRIEFDVGEHCKRLQLAGRCRIPELDRFALAGFAKAATRTGKSMARVLTEMALRLVR